MKIILLGRCCRISFDFIRLGLKQESSLFEWTWSNTMTEINYVLRKLLNCEEVCIVRRGENDFIEGTEIVTSHYINKNYQEIFNRRALRFIKDVKSENEILFVRDDFMTTIQREELVTFCELIRGFNPDAEFKMLLLSGLINEPIDVPRIFHQVYNPAKFIEYINECYLLDNREATGLSGDLSD